MKTSSPVVAAAASERLSANVGPAPQAVPRPETSKRTSTISASRLPARSLARRRRCVSENTRSCLREVNDDDVSVGSLPSVVKNTVAGSSVARVAVTPLRNEPPSGVTRVTGGVMS